MSFHKLRTLPVLSLAIYAAAASADPGAASSYVTDPQNTHVEDATSQGVGQVNMITCIASALRADALVNKGTYNALVDEAKCDPSALSSNASSSTQSAVYTQVIVNSTRTSNDDPMIAKIWLLESEGGHDKTIWVRAAASLPPSSANPYGVFRLDFCGHDSGSNGVGCLMNGYLDIGTSGITYYDTENRNDNGTPQTGTTALKLNAAATTSGSGSMRITSGSDQEGFNFAYNADLFRRADGDGNNDQCFSRDASDPETGQSVWRYGLYDATTGARVTLNSGFPVEYTSGGVTYQGYLGYYGLSLPPDAMNTLADGATVQKVDYGSSGGAPTKTSYTAVIAGGKLTKYTRKTRTLQSLDKIKIQTFINNATGFFAGAQANMGYELYWDDAAKNFKVTSQMNCGPSGCQMTALPSEQTVAVTYWQNMGGLQGGSQVLGGDVFIDLHGATSVSDSSAVNVVYRVQDLVYPAQMPTDLYCLRDCPTSASLAAYFTQNLAATPFAGATANNFNPTASGAVIGYHTMTGGTVLLDAVNHPVVFTNGDAYQQHPQYQNGVRSGRLFTTLSAAACVNGGTTYCDYKVNDLDVYYQWETGANPYNQFAAVKDSNNAIVAFDAPLQVTYDVPNNATLYKEFAGKSIVLQYGGYGDLWGIPGKCVSRMTNQEVACTNDNNSRYVPSFVIPYSTTTGKVKSGGTEYLVKWLDREIRFAKKNSAVCSTAGLALPSSVALPTGTDLKNPSDPNSTIYIGAKPTLTDAPRVIHGEVKY